jgi:hypothetical protein
VADAREIGAHVELREHAEHGGLPIRIGAEPHAAHMQEERPVFAQSMGIAAVERGINILAHTHGDQHVGVGECGESAGFRYGS